MRILLVSFCLLLTLSGKSQLNNYKSETSPLILKAIKKNRQYNFRTRTPIRVYYNADGIILKHKGKLKSLTHDGLYLSGFKRRDTVLKYISLTTVLSVNKLFRRDRLLFGIAGSVLLTSGLIPALQENSAGTTSFYSLIYYVYGVFPGALFLISIPVTYLQEIIGKKSSKRGWQFKIQ